MNKYASAILWQFDRRQWSWIMYDFANSVFATSVMVVFFPLIFSTFYAGGKSAESISLYLSLIISFSSVLVGLLAPLLSAIADSRRNKLTFLRTSIVFGVVFTAALAFIPPGYTFLSGVCYCFAHIGFALSLVFYDAFLPEIAHREQRSMLSSVAYALGYFGGGILLAVHVLLFVYPQLIGTSNIQDIYSLIFLTSALWWLLFSLPLKSLDSIESGNLVTLPILTVLSDAVFDVIETLKEIASRKKVFLFLLAFWIYIDAVYSVMKLAMDFGLSLKGESGLPLLGTQQLITALLLTQFIAFPMAIVFGALSRKIGEIRGVLIGLFVYVLICFSALYLSEVWHFFVLAAVVGCVQGGVQALSRSYFSSLIEDNNSSARYFAFYNLISKFATVLGPLLYGITTYFLHSQRLGVLSVGILFCIGITLLSISLSRSS